MHTATALSEEERICTVSGLTIHRKSEWTQVNCDTDYKANISVIGSRIILSQPVGTICLQGVKKTLALMDRIITENIPANQPFVVIEDFSNLQGATPDARKYYISNMRKHRWLAGLIFCSSSPLFKISIKLGKRLFKIRRELRLANDYSQAVKFALEMLSRCHSQIVCSAAETSEVTGAEQGAISAHNIIRNEAWFLNLDNFTTKMEVIDQKVLHSVSTGKLEVKHIESVANLRGKIQDAIMPEGSIEYMVADVSNLKGGSRKARKLYMDSLKQWHQTQPLRMYIFYGANRFMKAASNLAKPFMPFKVRVADGLDEALKIASEDQIENKNLDSPTGPMSTATNAAENGLIQRYVNDLQQFLGTIDWDREGLTKLQPPSPSHPFATVYESIALIKGELDELIQERDKAEEALLRANDELEGRVKERTSELEDANEDLRIEIHERKNIEHELKNAKQLAESASRAKSDFLANMSHELRTPLNHIIGFTELILDKKFGDLNETQEDYLNDVENSSKHLLSLINDILDLSKIEASKMEIQSSKIDLATLTENSLTMVKAKAMKHSIGLSLHIEEAVETITGDERKLKQILYNLLSNAVKFTPDGGKVWLTAQNYELGENHDPADANQSQGGVKISVSDTGIGLRHQDLNCIFSPFEQVDSSTSRKFSGTGLGLSLTKRFVELHGGRLWAESKGEGQGASFHFTLPLEQENIALG